MTALLILLLLLSPFVIFGASVGVACALAVIIDAIAQPFGRDPFSWRRASR